MKEQNNNSEFNPEKLHQKFDELWKTSDYLEVESYPHYVSFSKSLFYMDRERDYLLRRAIDLTSFKNVLCDDIKFNDSFLDGVWEMIKTIIENGIEYYDEDDEDEGIEHCEHCEYRESCEDEHCGQYCEFSCGSCDKCKKDDDVVYP